MATAMSQSTSAKNASSSSTLGWLSSAMSMRLLRSAAALLADMRWPLVCLHQVGIIGHWFMNGECANGECANGNRTVAEVARLRAVPANPNSGELGYIPHSAFPHHCRPYIAIAAGGPRRYHSAA